MSEIEDIEKARVAVQEILSALEVARIVCVDDTYEDTPPVEQVIVAAACLTSEMVGSILPEIGVASSDVDVRKKQIRDLWTRLDGPTRTDRTEKILAAARINDMEKTDDSGDASILSELIPKGLLLALSPKQWELRREELLKEDSKNRTLFLFDQDLSANGGDVQGGIKTIATLLSRPDSKNLICGLLTHTVTPEEQFKKWGEFSQTYNLPCDRFLIIPKQYLSKDPVLFAQVLKFIALLPNFSSLKKKAKKILAKATAVAATKVEEINIYDFDHIVFGVTAGEGLWEPDMLFRLHMLFHRIESRRLAHKGRKLEAIAQRLRSVSHIPTQAVSHFASSSWKLQQQELYENGDYLNQNHLPLELGDIFKKTETGSSKYFILLAQPCDLMVRSNGKRQPEIMHVPLAEIVCVEGCPDYAEQLPYFIDDPLKLWVVKLKQVHQVRTSVLDLCVFSDKGEAVLPIKYGPPVGIRPSMRERYKILQKEFARVVKHIDLLSPIKKDSADIKKIKESMKVPLSGAILNEGLFRGKITEHKGKRYICYNCSRISRLTRVSAFALLLGYTGCLGRPALDRDFGGSLELPKRTAI